jgi:hypothetical protein
MHYFDCIKSERRNHGLLMDILWFTTIANSMVQPGTKDISKIGIYYSSKEGIPDRRN